MDCLIKRPEYLSLFNSFTIWNFNLEGVTAGESVDLKCEIEDINVYVHNRDETGYYYMTDYRIYIPESEDELL